MEVVRLCGSLGMVGLGHIAFDGTKLKANASLPAVDRGETDQRHRWLGEGDRAHQGADEADDSGVS